MNCPKCNSPLPDGAKFCGRCGAKLTPAQPAPQRPAGQQTAPAAEKAVKPKKKNHVLPVLLAVILLVLLGTGGFFLLKNRSSASKNAYVVLQDGSYMLLTDLDKGEMVEIDGLRGETDDYSSLVSFSTDRKYLYYFSKVDGDTGTLCRAEYGKLKRDSQKNDQYLEVVDTRVLTGTVTPLDGEKLLYQRRDGELCYTDGQNTTVVFDQNCIYYVTQNRDHVVVQTDNGETNSLYIAALSQPDNLVPLDTGIAYNVSYAFDENNIIYCKQTDDGSAVYSAGIQKEPELLYSNLSSLGETGSSSLYMNYVLSDGFVERCYPETLVFAAGHETGTYDLPVYDLYVSEDGHSRTSVLENILLDDPDLGNCYLYAAASSPQSGTASEKFNRFSSALTERDPRLTADSLHLYIKASGKSYNFSNDAYNFIAEHGYNGLYATSAALYVFTPDECLYQAPLEGDTIGAFTLVDDNVTHFRFASIYYDTLYYGCHSISTPDIYTCRDGKSILLAEEVSVSGINFLPDGNAVFLYGTRGDAQLTLVDGTGRELLEADSPTSLCWLWPGENQLLYIDGGDLYFYNGSERSRAASDIEYVWNAAAVNRQPG